MVRDKRQHKIWVYFNRAGGRGFGHIGLILKRDNGQMVRYSQGAINPKLELFKLVIFAQQLKVNRKIFPPLTTINFIAKDAAVVELRTEFRDRIEVAIEEYINKGQLYHSFKNNCSGFISMALNASGDIKVKNRLVPAKLFDSLRLIPTARRVF